MPPARPRRRLGALIALIAGVLTGSWLGRLLDHQHPLPGGMELYAVEKSPNGGYACVVTRQHFHPPDSYTFTMWCLDPKSGDLLYPVDGPAQVVNENIEEGPPTRNVKLAWSGERLVVTFYWADGSAWGPTLIGDPADQPRWHWNDGATNGAAARPSARRSPESQAHASPAQSTAERVGPPATARSAR